MPDAEWSPGEVVGFCPECREEFYVPHGGKCPAEHVGDTPDLIEYVPASELTRLREGLERIAQKIDWAYEDACYTAPEDAARTKRQWAVLREARDLARELGVIE